MRIKMAGKLPAIDTAYHNLPWCPDCIANTSAVVNLDVTVTLVFDIQPSVRTEVSQGAG